MVINRPVDCAWFGAGGEAYLQVLRVGSGWRDSLLIDGCRENDISRAWSSDKTVAAYNPRRVGLDEIAMGVLGELGGSFPSGSAAAKRLRVMERRYVRLALEWVQCLERANS